MSSMHAHCILRQKLKFYVACTTPLGMFGVSHIVKRRVGYLLEGLTVLKKTLLARGEGGNLDKNFNENKGTG